MSLSSALFPPARRKPANVLPGFGLALGFSLLWAYVWFTQQTTGASFWFSQSSVLGLFAVAGGGFALGLTAARRRKLLLCA